MDFNQLAMDFTMAGLTARLIAEDYDLDETERASVKAGIVCQMDHDVKSMWEVTGY